MEDYIAIKIAQRLTISWQSNSITASLLWSAISLKFWRLGHMRSGSILRRSVMYFNGVIDRVLVVFEAMGYGL